ncbi:MAG TPA: hypothetical protein VGG19_10160 [Tepidisphaeraceae bacterium]|jgi:hypothetical protein
MTQLVVQLPDPILSAAKKLAERKQVSVEDFVAQMVSDAVKLDGAWEERITRGKQVSRDRFDQILSSAPDVPPIPGDDLDA